jgi:hypothetical protein
MLKMQIPKYTSDSEPKSLSGEAEKRHSPSAYSLVTSYAQTGMKCPVKLRAVMVNRACGVKLESDYSWTFPHPWFKIQMTSPISWTSCIPQCVLIYLQTWIFFLP